MKKYSIWMLAFTLLLGASISATKALAENCGNPETQTAMTHCAQQGLDTATKEINLVYNELRNKLDAPAKQSLKAEELAWIIDRDRKCKQDASAEEGGTMYPMELADCLTVETKARTKELRKRLSGSR